MGRSRLPGPLKLDVPPRVQLCVMLDPTLVRETKLLAMQYQMSMQRLVTRALRRFLRCEARKAATEET